LSATFNCPQRTGKHPAVEFFEEFLVIHDWIKAHQFFAHLLSSYENKALPSERVLRNSWFLYHFSPNWQRNGSVKISFPYADEPSENWAHNSPPHGTRLQEHVAVSMGLW